MAYLPDFNFNVRNELNHDHFRVQRYQPNNLPPIRILEDAFNKYILNNNPQLYSVCLAVEYKETPGGQIKTMFVSKNVHNPANNHVEINDHGILALMRNPITQFRNRNSPASRNYNVQNYAGFSQDISNFIILSITLCEIYSDNVSNSRGFIIPISLLYADRPNNYPYSTAMEGLPSGPGGVGPPIGGGGAFMPPMPNYNPGPMGGGPAAGAGAHISPNAARRAYRDKDCPICINSMEDMAGICMNAPCGHIFHCACMAQVTNNRCPICRSVNTSVDRISPEDVDVILAEYYREEAGVTFFGKKKPSKPSKRTSKKTGKRTRPYKAFKGLKIIPSNSSRPYHYARLTGYAALAYFKYDKNGRRLLTPTRYIKKYYPPKKAPSGKAKTSYTYRSMGDGTYIRIDKNGVPSTAFGKKKKKPVSRKKPAGPLGKSFRVTFTAKGVTFTDSTGKKVNKKLKKLTKKNSYSFIVKRRIGGAVYRVKGPIKKGKTGKATLYRKLR